MQYFFLYSAFLDFALQYNLSNGNQYFFVLAADCKDNFHKLSFRLTNKTLYDIDSIESSQPNKVKSIKIVRKKGGLFSHLRPQWAF